MAHVRNTQTHETKTVLLPTLDLVAEPGETVEVPDDAAAGLCSGGYFEPADKPTAALVAKAAKEQAARDAQAAAPTPAPSTDDGAEAGNELDDAAKGEDK